MDWNEDDGQGDCVVLLAFGGTHQLESLKFMGHNLKFQINWLMTQLLKIVLNEQPIRKINLLMYYSER